MASRILHLGACVALTIGVAAIAWWASPPRTRGAARAYLDHATGRYAIKAANDWRYAGREAGLTMHRGTHEVYAGELRRRYGVSIESGVSTPFAEGYNSVALRRLASRFGKDIFAECEASARRWEAENPEGRSP